MNDRLSVCRACLAPDPYLFLPLGDHPPANMFVRPEEVEKPQPAFPLNSQVCLECGLIQVADQVPADFFRHYLYVPSGATTMHTHFGELARKLGSIAGKGLIVDIGCNDGLLLRACNANGSKTLGIDPAANLAEIANSHGVKVHVAYFNPETAETVRKEHCPASVIVTTNTFNHIGDLHSFMKGVAILLADDGTFVIEVPRAEDLIDKNEFDTIYQEHVSEFSLLSMVKLGEPFGFVVADVDLIPIHGGSMRIYFRRKAAVDSSTPIVKTLLDEEIASGMQKKQTYDEFAKRVEKIRSDLIATLKDLKSQGKKIWGYGAPAKGNTLLNYFEIGPDLVEYLVDRNPLKHGLHSPGMKIPIRSADDIETERPDILLVLAWNFFDEIKEQQAAFSKRGGKFLVPLPEPKLV